MAGKGSSDVCGQNTPAKEAAGRAGGAELSTERESTLMSPARSQDPGHISEEEKTTSLQLRREPISSRRAQDLARTLKRSIWRSR